MNRSKQLMCLLLVLGLVFGVASSLAAMKEETDAKFWMEADVNGKVLTLSVYVDAEYTVEGEKNPSTEIGAATLNINYPTAHLTYQKFDTAVDKLMLQVQAKSGDPLNAAFSAYNAIPSGKLFDVVFDISKTLDEANFEFSIEVLDLFAADNRTELKASVDDLTVKYPPDTPEPPVTDTPVTDTPSEVPSVEPSEVPSEVPTDKPSGDPTDDPTVDPSGDPEVRIGDVNANGTIDAGDATMILRQVVGSTALTDTQRAAADVNGNGDVDAGDATMVLRIVVGAA